MILNGDGTTSQGIGGYRNVGRPADGRLGWLHLGWRRRHQLCSRVGRGASAVSAPADFGPFGRGATLTDPTGATFSIWKSSEGDQPDPAKTPVGGWCWNELWTTDDAARAGVLRAGVRLHPRHDGNGRRRHLLHGEDRRRHPRRPDALGARRRAVDVAALCGGGRLRCHRAAGQGIGRQGARWSRSDIPNIGRYAIFEDTLGAAVAFIKLAG